MERESFSLHHTAIVVRDLSKSVAFYCDNFGGAIDHDIQDVSGPDAAALHQLDAVRLTRTFLRFGTTQLELLMFAEPEDGRDLQTRANDYGVRHICFQSPDVAAAYKQLSGRGIEFTRPPHIVNHGDGTTTVLAFCFDLDGTRIELLQPPAEAAVAGADALSRSERAVSARRPSPSR